MLYALSICSDADSRWVAPHNHGEKIVKTVRSNDMQGAFRLDSNTNRRCVFGPGRHGLLKRAERLNCMTELPLKPKMDAGLIGDLPRYARQQGS
jgi:hypothetical protein